MPFTKFWFEGNLAFDIVDSYEKLEWLILQYSGNLDECREYAIKNLKNAKINPTSHMKIPEFGTYLEHKGEQTLGAFFEENGMEWSKEPTA